MANQDQLNILKQGVDVWNKWRVDNPTVQIDLGKVDLSEINHGRPNLNKVDLHDANIQRAILIEASMIEVDLSGADFTDSDLWECNLRGANLKNGDFAGANLMDADLSGADAKYANLHYANLTRAKLRAVNLGRARIGRTILSGINLSRSHIEGLEYVIHESPSYLSLDTIKFSNGEIPTLFLRGCGLSDWEIEAAKLYNPELNNEEINKILYKMYDLRGQQSLQISPLFISYSHSDSEFVNKLETLLNEKGIRFWRDIHSATSG